MCSYIYAGVYCSLWPREWKLYNFLKSTLSSLFMVMTAGHSYLQGLQSPETFEGIGFYALDLISFQVTEEKYHICTVKP